MRLATVVEELGRIDSGPDAVRATLARWRRFWGTVAPEGLTPEEARGLFGELWFLLVWLLPHGADSIERWTPPAGDTTFNGRARLSK